MLIIFEPICEGREHSPFNTGIVEAATRLASDHRVMFAGESSHVQAVRELLSDTDSKVEWRDVRIAPRRQDRFARRFFDEWRSISHVWKIADREKPEAVIFTGASESGLLALKAKIHSAGISCPVAVVFHSILGEFLCSRKQRLLLAFGNSPKLRFIVLGKHIRKDTEFCLPALRNRIYDIPHPCVGLTTGASSLSRDLVRFGFLGLASIAKGFPSYLRLIEDVRQRADMSRVGFELIGRCAAECKQQFDGFRSGSAGDQLKCAIEDDKHWPMAFYHERLREVAYAVLPYDARSYRYTSSGAALDAIAMVKPMIALRTPGFCEMFDRLGDVGYLCDSYEHLLSTVLDIVNNPPLERYQRQCANILSTRSWFGGASVADHLKLALRS